MGTSFGAKALVVLVFESLLYLMPGLEVVVGTR